MNRLFASYQSISYKSIIAKGVSTEFGASSSASTHQDLVVSLFEDGTMCNKYNTENTEEGLRSDAGSIIYHSQVCVEECPGSNQGIDAAWRRTFGRIPIWFIPRFGTAGPILATCSLLIILSCCVGLLSWTLWMGRAFARFTAILIYLSTIPKSRSWDRSECHPQADSFSFGILSDLHISSSVPYEIIEDSTLWPHKEPADTQARFAEVLCRMLKRMSGLKRPLLAILGDITDLGKEDEWEKFGEVTERMLDCRQFELLPLPGNHDVSINKRFAIDRSLHNRQSRENAYYEMFEKYCFHSSGPNSEQFPILLRLEPNGTIVKEPTGITDDPSIHLIAVDSNRYKSHHILSNALGYIGKRQCRRLRSMLKTKSGPVAILLHHHIAVPRSENIGFPGCIAEAFTIALDCRRFVKILLRYSRRTGNHPLVIHGHRHKEYFERLVRKDGSQILIFGMPSSTIGKKNENGLDGRLYHAIACLDSEMQWHIEVDSDVAK